MAGDSVEIYAKAGADAGACYEAYVRAFTNTVADIEAAPLPDPEAFNGAFLAYYSHVLDLAFDKYGIPQEGKEEYRMCNACWCDTCEKLNVCGEYPRSDGITPPPCAICEDQPLHPKAKQPACGKYAPEI